MTAKHHHFLSQFYLRGFICEQSEKQQLAVIDIKRNISFETNPRNVGGVRDFNRIEIKGIDPNFLEHELSKTENQVATELKNLRKTLNFSGETKELILSFMALIACRSPKRREDMRQTDFKKYNIEIPRENYILAEMFLIEAILPCLFDRRWLLVIADKKSGPFITTDNPVNLLWKDSEKISPFHRGSPGFGLKETQVYFPISPELALIGEFDGYETNMKATEDLVAMFNRIMLCNCHTQIYAPKFDFKFLDRENNILSSKDLLKYSST